MTKAFLIDLSHCNGCYNCQIVCKDEHCEKDWLPYAAAQPMTGQFWMKIDEKVRGQVPWVRVSYVPTLCAHCGGVNSSDSATNGTTGSVAGDGAGDSNVSASGDAAGDSNVNASGVGVDDSIGSQAGAGASVETSAHENTQISAQASVHGNTQANAQASTQTNSAPCMVAAAAAGKAEAVYRRKDGLVIFDPAFAGDLELARILAKSCPLGAVYVNEDCGLAQKCSGCAHLLDNGWAVPRCVDACPHDAIQFKEEDEFGALLANAEVLPAVLGLGAKVYYMHLPKRFVAGTIVDFAADEVVIGARVELATAGSPGFIAALETDELGDFKFDQVPAAVYTLTVTADGFEPLVVTANLSEQDLSLGDLNFLKK